MPGTVAYWILSGGFCVGWLAAARTVYASRWNVLCPWFSRWLALQGIQAILTTVAGMWPTTWWTLRVWLPVEVLCVVAVIFSCAEILPRRLVILVAVAASISTPFVIGQQPMGPALFGSFISFREWLWLTVAIALTIHLLMLWWHPLNLAPGTMEVWIILAVYAAAMALTGLPIPHSKLLWLNTRAIYRAVAILCCAGWVMLGPTMRAATAPTNSAA